MKQTGLAVAFLLLGIHLLSDGQDSPIKPWVRMMGGRPYQGAPVPTDQHDSSRGRTAIQSSVALGSVRIPVETELVLPTNTRPEEIRLCLCPLQWGSDPRYADFGDSVVRLEFGNGKWRGTIIAASELGNYDYVPAEERQRIPFHDYVVEIRNGKIVRNLPVQIHFPRLFLFSRYASPVPYRIDFSTA